MQLARQIIFTDKLTRPIRFIAGVDAAYMKNMSIGAAVVLDYDSLKLVETKTATRETRFSYIPTLLSFRELPSILAAFRKLQTHPDLVMVDGQGYAHPYHFGLACHLGLTLNIPTIGVAKSRLIGDIERSPRAKDTALLKFRGETVGTALTTRIGSPPIFVSVGHMISLKSAVSVVKHCILQNRVPEPIMKAHEAANFGKRKVQILSITNRRKVK